MITAAASPLLLTFDIFANRTDVTAFVTTRVGGLSNGHLSSLNMGLSEFEPAQATIGNRMLVCKAANIDFEKLTFQHQVHGSSITIVNENNAGAGNRVKAEALPDSDAMITATPGITLFAQAADCVPIAAYDPIRKVAAAIHAGWRGTAQRIAAKTIQKMVTDFGCNPQNILVGIGPSIGKCCYEVGPEVVDIFKREFGFAQSLFTATENGQTLDLWSANQLQLEEVGVLASNIEVAGICTKCCCDKFYSSRADSGKTGRFGVGIAIA